MVGEIVEDVLGAIDVASSEQIAGLLSGRTAVYLTGDFDVVVLPSDAEYDLAFRQAYGNLYDLAIHGMDSYSDGGEGYEMLAEAVEIVGMPSDEYVNLKDLESDGWGDEIRAKALESSVEFMLRQRHYLKSLVDPSLIEQVYQEALDDEQ